MKNSLVSIVMPTYNRPKTLSRAIDSCLNQTHKNIEILVVDDNNSDSEARLETEKLMQKYKNNKQVVYLKMPKNSGACKARNYGIQKSKGEYVTFLDDDDVFFPNTIEMQLNYIIKNNYDVTFGETEYYNEETNESYYHKYNKNFNLTRESLLRKHLVDIISSGIAFFYKRKVLIEIGGFYDIPASQEYILMLKTIAGGYKIGYHEFVCARGYMHNSENGITGSLKAIEAKKQVIKLVKPYLKELKFRDRRKVLYRLNAFIFISYLRKGNVKCIKYGFKILPYLDLLIISRLKKPKRINNTEYI